MPSRSRRAKTGTVLFFIPIVLVIAVVVYSVISATASVNGTLEINAQSSGRYFSSSKLNVSASVGTSSGITPFSLELPQGVYTVVFSGLKWYETPPPREVTVSRGVTSFAVAIYDPILQVVSVQGNQFNSTKLVAEHGVTPVIWVNHMGDYAVMTSTLTGNILIPPSQNFTYIFKEAGTYEFSLPISGSNVLTIVVS